MGRVVARLGDDLELNSVRLFGDDLSAERLPEQIGVRPRVLLENLVVLPDRIRLFLRRQRYIRNRRSLSRSSPSLLSRNSRLRRPPLTTRLLPPIPTPLLPRLLFTGLLPSCPARLLACQVAGGLPADRFGTSRGVPRVHPRRLVVVLRIRRLLQRNRSSTSPLSPRPPTAAGPPGPRTTRPRTARTAGTTRDADTAARGCSAARTSSLASTTPSVSPGRRTTRTANPRPSQIGTSTTLPACSRPTTAYRAALPSSQPTTRIPVSAQCPAALRPTWLRSARLPAAAVRTTQIRLTALRPTALQPTRLRSAWLRAAAVRTTWLPATCLWTACLWAAWLGAGAGGGAASRARVGRWVYDCFDSTVDPDRVDHRLTQDLVTSRTRKALPRPSVHQPERQGLVVDRNDLRVLTQHDPGEPPLGLDRIKHLRPQPPNIRQPDNPTTTCLPT